MKIAAMLLEAMEKKRMTRGELARKTGVDRVFLWSLLKGQPPPRARDGHRLADEDPRYQKLAEVLGLNEAAFVTQALDEQRATALRSREGTAFDMPQGESELMGKYRELARSHPELQGSVASVHYDIRQVFEAARNPGVWLSMVENARKSLVVARAREVEGFLGETVAPRTRQQLARELLGDAVHAMQIREHRELWMQIADVFYGLSVEVSPDAAPSAKSAKRAGRRGTDV